MVIAAICRNLPRQFVIAVVIETAQDSRSHRPVLLRHRDQDLGSGMRQQHRDVDLPPLRHSASRSRLMEKDPAAFDLRDRELLML
ncbi:hypothetical protein ACIPWI_36900 [Streptomyces sp. NPDC090046]|uniref:hypothetical protein n=1 Tax=Streptomyces sp. NPDC090046 TaxID=3365928 RepID=UPI0037F202B4